MNDAFKYTRKRTEKSEAQFSLLRTSPSLSEAARMETLRVASFVVGVW